MLDNVAEDLAATCPDFPKPIVTTIPLQFNIKSHALSKLLFRSPAKFALEISYAFRTFLAIEI